MKNLFAHQNGQHKLAENIMKNKNQSVDIALTTRVLGINQMQKIIDGVVVWVMHIIPLQKEKEICPTHTHNLPLLKLEAVNQNLRIYMNIYALTDDDEYSGKRYKKSHIVDDSSNLSTKYAG